MSQRIFDVLAGAIACGLVIFALEFAVPFLRRALTRPHPFCRGCEMGRMAKVGREREEPSIAAEKSEAAT